MAVELSRVQADVQDLGLAWQPGETVHAGQSLLRLRSRLGAVPPRGAPDLAERRRVAATRGADAERAGAAALPTKVDWRAKGGNFVTPVRDQQYCGSCVAFGVVAVLESMVRITGHAPRLDLDLSEAQLFFCYGPDHGALACPDGGWWPDDAYACLRSGVVDEACFPYTDDDQPCRLGPDAKNRVTTASTSTMLESVSAMKRHLATRGPLTACFTIYEDFQSFYTGGVYRYHEKTSGEEVGGHCVCIIGYDDAQRCWIAKNSWGTAWGEKGFFRIGYGECGIDASMWGITGTVRSPALSTLHVLGTAGGSPATPTVDVRHTVRSVTGWQAEPDTVPTPAGAGSFTTLDAAGVGRSLHVVGLGSAGGASNLWHTVRNATGTWQPAFGRVSDPGKAHHLDAAACAGVGADLHVLMVEQGVLRHTIRKGTGGWQASFGSPAVPGSSAPVTAVGCAGVGTDLHVVLVRGGELWHTRRDARGAWHPTGTLSVPAAAGPLTAVGCAGAHGALHVVAAGAGGTASNLWHTLRAADGTWQPKAGNIKDPGLGRHFDDVGCAGVGGDLHLVARLGDDLWHTLRSAAGRWQPAFGHLRALGDAAGAPFVGLGVAGVR